VPLFCAPAYLIEPYQCNVRYAKVNELLNRLLAAFQGRSIDFVKGNMAVGRKKCLRLTPSQVVEVRINPASLDDILQIKIGLSVTYEVNFFTDQFCTILAPPSYISRFTCQIQAGAKITD
jgi:hypothetical protein